MIKRYRLGGDFITSEDENGEWVRFEDIKDSIPNFDDKLCPRCSEMLAKNIIKAAKKIAALSKTEAKKPRKEWRIP